MPTLSFARVGCAFAALLVATAVPRLEAQDPGRIVGRVVESGQGAPVAGAQVELVEGGGRAVSALDGRYLVEQVPAGPVSIRVRMIGFAPKGGASEAEARRAWRKSAA